MHNWHAEDIWQITAFYFPSTLLLHFTINKKTWINPVISQPNPTSWQRNLEEQLIMPTIELIIDNVLVNLKTVNKRYTQTIKYKRKKTDEKLPLKLWDEANVHPQRPTFNLV